MKEIEQLELCGYNFAMKDERLRYKPPVGIEPPPQCRALLETVKTNEQEAIHYLVEVRPRLFQRTAEFFKNEIRRRVAENYPPEETLIVAYDALCYLRPDGVFDRAERQKLIETYNLPGKYKTKPIQGTYLNDNFCGVRYEIPAEPP